MKLTSAAFPGVCVASGLPRPEPEYVFAPPRRWAFDFGFRDERIAVEIEGGVYGKGKPCPVCGKRQGGAHGSVAGKLRDIAKYRQAAILGWRVLPVLPKEFESGKVFEFLSAIFQGVNHEASTPSA